MSSKDEARTLKVQLEEQRERARKEMQEVQRHGNDAQTELDRSQTNLKRLEEEVCLNADLFGVVLVVSIIKRRSSVDVFSRFDT